MSRFVQIPGKRGCKKCHHLKNIEEFVKYKRNNVTKHGYTCLDCNREKARKAHREAMKDPNKRLSRNKKVAQQKNEKYHQNEEYRNKIKTKSSELYYREKEEIIEFLKIRYQSDPEYRQRKIQYNKKRQFRDAADQYSNVYGFFMI